MRNVARLKWIASFDMENLVGAILQNGMLLSVGLVIAGLFLQWVTTAEIYLQEPLHGENVLQFVLQDLHRAVSPKSFSLFLVHLGIAALMLTPYLRLVVSFFYFAYVDRHWRYAFLTILTLTPLTYFLLLG